MPAGGVRKSISGRRRASILMVSQRYVWSAFYHRSIDQTARVICFSDRKTERDGTTRDNKLSGTIIVRDGNVRDVFLCTYPNIMIENIREEIDAPSFCAHRDTMPPPPPSSAFTYLRRDAVADCCVPGTLAAARIYILATVTPRTYVPSGFIPLRKIQQKKKKKLFRLVYNAGRKTRLK